MVLISSLYLFWDARSWPDKVHDAWLPLGLALAGPWPGPGWPLAWPLAGPVQTGSGSNQFQFRLVPVQTGSGSDRFGSNGSGSIRSHPEKTTGNRNHIMFDKKQQPNKNRTTFVPVWL